MSAFATITIGGRLSKDAVVSTYSGDQIKIALTIPVDKPNAKTSADTAWYNIALFGRQADAAMKLLDTNGLRKGQELVVTGRLSINHWVDRNGMPRTSLDVVCDSFHLMGKRQPQDTTAPTQNSETTSEELAANVF